MDHDVGASIHSKPNHFIQEVQHMSIYTDNYRRNLINYWRQYFPQWDIPKGYHVHHIIPVCEGGTHHPKNLIALHPDDHVSIHRCRGDKVSDSFILIGSLVGIGKKRSNETKNKISDSTKQYWDSEDGQKKKERLIERNKTIHSQHMKELCKTKSGRKRIENLAQIVRDRAKKVQTPNGIYSNVYEAAEKENIAVSSVYYRCSTGKRHKWKWLE